MARIPFVFLGAGLLALCPATVAVGPYGVPALVQSTALADDDDGGGGGGGGRGGGGGGRGGVEAGGTGSGWINPYRRGRSASPGLFRIMFGATGRRSDGRRSRPARAAARAGADLVVLGLAEDDLVRLRREGFRIRAERATRQGRLVRLAAPARLSSRRALGRVAQVAPTSVADLNHAYRLQQSPSLCTARICSTWSLIEWSAAVGAACSPEMTIGVVDTAVDIGNEALAGSKVDVLSVASDGRPKSGARHGTAVVAMLVGAPDGPAPGLLPQARVVAVDSFSREGNQERADAFGLLVALDLLAARQIKVVNLSLAGPDNRILARSVADMVGAGTTLVAAVGNDGPRSAPLYPASYPGVIGVTAVDAKLQGYRRAARGGHVDFAAPGVGIPTADLPRGIRIVSGTSFATPFVTASVTALLARGLARDPASASARLAETTRDLGSVGWDPQYGNGLVKADGACQDDVAPAIP